MEKKEKRREDTPLYPDPICFHNPFPSFFLPSLGLDTPTHPATQPTQPHQTVDALYATAKGKPEWQAAAVKAFKGLDLAGLK